MKKIALITITTFLITSCSIQPECAEEETKELSLEIAQELLVISSTTTSFLEENQNNPFYLRIAQHYGVQGYLNLLDKEIRTELNKTLLDSTTATYQHIINAIDKVTGLEPSLRNIRTMQIQDELRKCSC